MLVRAREDPDVLGVIVSGSRAVASLVTPLSDFDCYIVLRNGASEVGQWDHVRGQPVETVPVTLDHFRSHATAGSPTFWNRPSFLHARVEFEVGGGEVAAALEAKRRLTPEEADLLVREWIGGYINSLYRSLKNFRDGRSFAGRLDALESLSPLLTTVFALLGRVRPFNKALAYELDREPLPIPDFLARLEHLARDPGMATQQELFRDFEAIARAAGYGDLVDDWHPDVPFF